MRDIYYLLHGNTRELTSYLNGKNNRVYIIYCF